MKLNCFESCLEYIFRKYENIDYRILFADSFSLGYNCQFSSIGERLSLPRNGQGISANIYEILACHNITITPFPYIKVNSNLDIICYLDTYFCPSSPFFLKEHIDHYVVVKDVKEQNIIYDDPYFNSYNNCVKLDAIIENVKMFRIEVGKSKIVDKKRLLNISLKNVLRVVDGKNQEQAVLFFAKDFKHSFKSIIKETNEEAISTSLFLRQLAYISWGRKNFVEFLISLDFIDDKTINYYKDLSNTWELLLNLLIRGIVSKQSFDSEYIIEIINRIVDFEVQGIKILNRIVSWLK